MVHSHLQALRELVQQRMGVDLADRKPESRSFAKRSLEALTCSHGGRAECDRGKMLFSRSFLTTLTLQLAGVGHASRWHTSKVGGMMAEQGTHAASTPLAGSFSASSVAFNLRRIAL